MERQVDTQPILQLPSFKKLFTLECGPSGLAVGGVLSQEGRLVAFYSEKLNEAKKNWRHYLLPKEFFVFIDNQSLGYINIQEKLSNKNLKWMEYL